jgi:hypothetical protein
MRLSAPDHLSQEIDDAIADVAPYAAPPQHVNPAKIGVRARA